MMMRTALILTFIGGVTMLSAQTRGPRFDVASIKPNKNTSDRQLSRIDPGGAFRATRTSLRVLILMAYEIEAAQLVGGPSWIQTEHFDIVARATGELTRGGAQPTLPGALQTLIKDRFRLVAHTEVREVPAYALTVMREGRLGPNLSPSPINCAAIPIRERSPGDCRVSAPGAPGRYFAASGSIRGLVASLRAPAGRPVIDQTGLQGNFRIELNWASLPPASLALLAATPADEPLPSREGPSIFTAVEEQLGLKLEPAHSSVEFLVIDSVERPTPD